jgi:GntR family transcriptional regulator
MRRNVPLVDQVTQEIIAQIDDGTLARANGGLPSEAELAQRFDVSRATVRDALTRLELAGVIVRRQGVGTFVNPFLSQPPTSIQDWFEEARGFADVIRCSGKDADCRILETAIKPAAKLASQLQIDPDEPVLAITKVVLMASVPTILSVNALPVNLIQPAFREQAHELGTHAESVYRFLETYCNRRIHHQQSELRAVSADEQLAARLEIAVGAPCLRVEEVGYSDDLAPAFYGLNHYRGDMVSLRQIRRPTINITQPIPPPSE